MRALNQANGMMIQATKQGAARCCSVQAAKIQASSVVHKEIGECGRELHARSAVKMSMRRDAVEGKISATVMMMHVINAMIDLHEAIENECFEQISI